MMEWTAAAGVYLSSAVIVGRTGFVQWTQAIHPSIPRPDTTKPGYVQIT